MSFYQKLLDYKAKNQVYVIAEVGSNYKSRSQLLDSVNLAKNCGADAVKFQYLNTNELYEPRFLFDSELPMAQLKEKAEAIGIDLLCSSFSPEGMAQIDSYVPAHKIASSEMSHIRMLEKACALKKPILLSTGAYFLKDIDRVLKYLKVQNAEVIPLHCNVAYPTKFVDVSKFSYLRDASVLIGYSDHTTSIDAVPLYMKALGATVYEKHFNPFDLTDTPDAPHSLNVNEFKTMVACLKNTPIAFSEENEARLKHVRRVIATKDIMPGEKLVEGENIGIFRSKNEDANGVNPFVIFKLEGKTCNHALLKGQGVSLLDVD